MQEWELSLQRQLGTATVLSVSYIGTVGRQLLTFEESNPGDQALCLELSNPAKRGARYDDLWSIRRRHGLYDGERPDKVEGTRPTFGD